MVQKVRRVKLDLVQEVSKEKKEKLGLEVQKGLKAQKALKGKKESHSRQC